MQPAWTRLVELGERLPHALLFVGRPGLGQRELAARLARAWSVPTRPGRSATPRPV